MKELKTAIKGLTFELDNRQVIKDALKDEKKRSKITQQVATINIHVKDIKRELKAITEAIKVADGYTTEALALLKDEQLSIFDML